MNNESKAHDQERHGEEAKASTEVRRDSGGVVLHQTDGAAPGVAEAEAPSPVALTDGERRSYRMGALRGVEIAADFIRPGDAALSRRIELCRIAIAARAVPCDAPEFWPARGGP